MASANSSSSRAFGSLFWRILLPLFLLTLQVYAHGGSSDDESGDSQPVELHAKSLIRVKIWALVILLVSTFSGGVSPYFFRWNESFLLLGTQFAAGVFLGTALMHFLADSNSTFEDLTTKTYPFAFMLTASGYLLTMLGDCIIGLLTRGIENKARIEAERNRDAESYRQSTEEKERDHHGPVFAKTSSLSDTILLILALCSHSIFEGIAIGVAKTTGDAWKNLWTISLHKIFAAIAMGIALLRLLPKRPFLTTGVYSFAFAVSSPIGVGIGIAIDATTQGPVADWIYAIAMGIATGVFIFVAINHLIAKGFKPQEPNYFDTAFFKLLAVTAGVGVIAVVMIWDA